MRKRIAFPLCLILIGTAALAAPKPPGQHLNVTEVTADIDAGTLTIVGEDFDFGPGPLVVTLGEYGLLTINFDDATLIDALLPVGIVAGDYLLTVSTGKGQSQSDEYDLTIGAVGGGQLPDDTRPSGEFVTGITDGLLVCAPPPAPPPAVVIVSVPIENPFEQVLVECPPGFTLISGGVTIPADISLEDSPDVSAGNNYTICEPVITQAVVMFCTSICQP